MSEPASAAEPERLPERVAAPQAEETTALPAAVPVPAALVDHARKVADDHHARTGVRIDTDTLRTRLGVPPHLADAIASQLT